MSARVVRQMWDVWEKLFHFAARLQAIQPGENHLFYIAKRRYIGRTFHVQGITVRPFDVVVELHMNNDLVAEVVHKETQVMAIAVRLLHEARRSFPALARAVMDEKYKDAKVLYGVTFINRGIQKLGFEVFSMHGGLSRYLTNWHLKNVFRMINPAAVQIFATHRAVFEPRLVAIPVERLVELYGQQQTADEKLPIQDHCLT